MINKKTVIISIGIFLLCSIIVCIGVFTFTKPDSIIRVALSRSSNMGFFERGDVVYYFDLKSNGELIIKKGIISGADITESNFLKTVKEESTISLSESEKNQLIELADNIPESDFFFDDSIVFDSYGVIVYYKDKIAIRHGGSDSIFALKKQLIELSPIEVKFTGGA